MNANTRKLINNIGWMTFDKIFMLVINLLVTVKIANYYGTLGYGTYQYAVSVIAIFEVIVCFVDARVVKKHYPNCDENSVAFTATVSRLLFSGISLLVGLFYILLFSNDSYYSLIFILLLFNAIFTNLRFGMANRFEYHLKSRKVVVAQDIATLIGSVLQLVAVSFDLPIFFLAVIALINSTINVIIVALQYRYEYKINHFQGFEKKLFKMMILESSPLAVAAACAIIYSKCDTIMVGSLMSKSDVGIYAIAAKLISIVEIGVGSVRESVYPGLIKLYSIDLNQYKKRYIKISSILTWIYIVGVAVSFIVLPFCFKVLNQEYQTAFPVYQIYVLGSFFIYNAALRAGHFTMINKGSILMVTQMISVAVNIVLNFVAIKMWGIYGAALATALTQGISLMLSNLFFGKEGREVLSWQIKAINPKYIFLK